ncbi:methyltransferase [Wenjunlia tyrosinilytica]|jgi:C-methyltransferase|uniref:O-methyltransferase n=1 Tax=Wenjunlia tyrosinilytica TaxID=1544741 RepID=A0A918DZT3_9ACTN|nr:methyltransferase [Wenjunlia tyrosinilytica]GGO94980.1 O-methyltransferase [Wenjunlia tyrosinilytica]
MTQADAPRAAAVGRLQDLLFGYATAAMVHTAVGMGVFDLIDDNDGKPAHAPELAASVGADPDAFNRLLRALAVQGVLEEAGEGCYQHTELSRLLRSDAPGGVARMARLSALPAIRDPWTHLDEAVRTGGSVFAKVFGRPMFQHFAEDPESGGIFNEGMTANTQLFGARAAESVDLSGATTVADIGGGHGALLAALLRLHPHVYGVLFDLEPVVKGAVADLTEGGGLADRCRIVAGDAHNEIPVEADVYLLKHILHMWDDETSVRALRNIAASARPGARVLVLEMLIGGGGPYATYHSFLDLFMLLSPGGRERTEAEFATLFERAGLVHHGVTPVTGGQLALIEARVPDPAARS